MRYFVALPIVLSLLAGPVQAGEPAKDEDKIVCKRNETYITGSRLSRPKKTCMKTSDWKQVEDEKNRTLKRVQDGRVSPDQPSTLGGGPG